MTAPGPGPAPIASPSAVRRRVRGALGRVGLAIAVPGLAAGCGSPPAAEPDAARAARSPGGAVALAAADATAPAGDLRPPGRSELDDLAALVVLLDADDPVVRMAAIRGLEARTGDRLGYDPVVPRAERAPAVRRWARRVETERADAARRTSDAGGASR